MADAQGLNGKYQRRDTKKDKKDNPIITVGNDEGNYARRDTKRGRSDQRLPPTPTTDEMDGRYKKRETTKRDKKDKTIPTTEGFDNTPKYYNLPNPQHHPPRGRPSIDHSPRDSPRGGRSDSSLPATPEPSPRPQRRTQTRRDKNIYYRQMNYNVDETPPWPVCIFLGFQHYLIMFGATVANPMVMMPWLCVDEHDAETKSELIGTIFVVAGISTILQSSIGVRLPIVQGGTFTFVVPCIALLSLPKWKCPGPVALGLLNNTVTSVYDVLTTTTNITAEQPEPPWLPRIREIQGAIMMASLFQIAIGFSGIIGIMLKFIGPLSITPTISLAGLALFSVAADKSEGQWWITLVTVILIAAFSQYTKNIKIPCISYEKGKGFKAQPFPIFKLFPVILAIGITWIICAILTATGVFPSDPTLRGYKAGTHTQLDVLEKAAWFRVPYPGQWGMPTVSAAGVFGLLAGTLTSIVESVGDYYACARMSRVPPPPVHAINRGIGVEGFASFLAGAFGSGSGTTSYSENIGAIGITKVGSRRVIQCAGVIMIIFGVFNKFGSVFATIPEPIIGGVFIVMFGMIVAVGLSNLQFVDLNSSRNLFIIGFSFFFGITLPTYLQKVPEAIKTGSMEVDQILTVLLKTNMFVGGLSGFILDNTIPGTDEERGIAKWSTHAPAGENRETAAMAQLYDIPYITPYLKRHSWTRYVPFLPTYEMGRILSCVSKKKRRNTQRMRRNQNDGGTAV